MQTSQTGGQRFSDTSPFTIPWTDTFPLFSADWIQTLDLRINRHLFNQLVAVGNDINSHKLPKDYFGGRHDIQHNDTQHNNTQRNEFICDTLHKGRSIKNAERR
jgi:hypothetical protein